MTTRYGRKVRSKKCPNKNCRNYKGGMDDIGSRDYVNLICQLCGCHYEGEATDKKLKFLTKKEWDERVKIPKVKNNPK
jgi:hypothetical protein